MRILKKRENVRDDKEKWEPSFKMQFNPNEKQQKQMNDTAEQQVVCIPNYDSGHKYSSQCILKWKR